jgi:CRP-like cAMP-binding protein
MTKTMQTATPELLQSGALAGYEPFAMLSPHYLDEAQAELQMHRFPRGKLIFKRAKLLDRAFYLVSGRLDLIDNAYEVEQVRSGTDRAKVALNQDSPTTVSAIAKAECVLFSIDKAYLDRLVSWSDSVEQPRTPSDLSPSEFSVEEVTVQESSDWMSSLLQCPLFTRVPTAQLQELFASFETHRQKQGEQVIREGERGEYFYVLAAGKARITNKLGTVDVEIGPGQYFGDEALIGNTLRNATVTMTSDGVLKRLTAESFNKLLMSPVLQYLEPAKLETLGKPYKLLDVKMPVEFRVQHLPGSINVPLSRLRKTIPEFGHSHVYAVVGDAGSRADIAAHILCQAGFDAVVVKNDGLQESA